MMAAMHWFRSRARWGTSLALFALALQLVLSFGHVHLADARSSHLSTVAAVQPPAETADPASLPGHHDDGGPADEYCPICALVHLGNTLIAADAPTLALPVAFAEFHFASTPDAALTVSSRTPFSARAPPIV
jgi:hypothetical protein